MDHLLDQRHQQPVMDPGLLYESPFWGIHHDCLDGVFDDDHADKIVSIVRQFNSSAEAVFGRAAEG